MDEKGRAYQRDWKRGIRKSRLERGLCPRCGKGPPQEGRALCAACLEFTNSYRRRYYEANRARLLSYGKAWRSDKRHQVLEHYGGKCVCCGEDNPAFLTIDHIDGGGNEHRRQIFGTHGGVGPFTDWLWRNNFPPGFQVLCWNCNAAKAYNPGGCPHQQVNNANPD